MKKKFVFLRSARGFAMVEFAVTLPVLLLIFYFTFETSRYVLLNQKLDKVAHAMNDFVTQGTNACGDLDTYVQAVPQIIKPFDFSGTVIFSSVSIFPKATDICEGNTLACINWQKAKLGSDASQIGSEGGNANIPSGYVVQPGQNIIVTEAYLDYAPVFEYTSELIPAFAAKKLYKIAIYKPRQGTLTTLCN